MYHLCCQVWRDERKWVNQNFDFDVASSFVYHVDFTSVLLHKVIRNEKKKRIGRIPKMWNFARAYLMYEKALCPVCDHAVWPWSTPYPNICWRIGTHKVHQGVWNKKIFSYGHFGSFLESGRANFSFLTPPPPPLHVGNLNKIFLQNGKCLNKIPEKRKSKKWTLQLIVCPIKRNHPKAVKI